MAAVLILLPNSAYAQNGSISGQARDASGAALPGVTVEVSSPALIEKVRSTTTGDNGRYQITALPVGTYKVTFTLAGFSVISRENVVLTTDFTANVNADMKVGDLKEVVDVTAEAPTVDVANARQQQVISSEAIRDLPTARNIGSIMTLVPGLTQGGAFGGICNGGVGVFCAPTLSSFNAHNSINDGEGLNQGRLLIDGIPINAGNSSNITGTSNGYNADVANAQEVTFTLSGSLGESETGGAAINIVPRTGGNRYAGNFFTSYTETKWFDRNNGTRRGAPVNVLINDHDIQGSFGGPIVKDRFWFYSVGRHQGKESNFNGSPFFYNLNEGIWGANYMPDRSRDPLTYTNEWKNINTRFTVQATQKDKFNVFWDEQDSCQDPCRGTVASYWSPEAIWSVIVRPQHLGQLTWTNPLTNRLLLEAGMTYQSTHYDVSRNRFSPNPSDIPAIRECGSAGLDDIGRAAGQTAVNSFAGVCNFGGWGGLFETALASGSITGGSLSNQDTYRSRASASYITGSHNAKIGFDGAVFNEINRQTPNAPQLTYLYRSPVTTGNTAVCGPTAPNIPATGLPPTNFPYQCGNMTNYYPDDPYNLLRRPAPDSFQMNTGPRQFDEQVMTNSVYIQDQWTVDRFTLNGALRYDNSRSDFGETCVGPNQFVPVGYCTPAQKGVNFNDITPRWGLAWDVFGDGKTSLKWNMGKYLQAANIGGIYTAANPARRTQNTLTRFWTDLDGDRIIDCDPLSLSNNTDPVSGDFCGGLTGGSTTTQQRQFGRDPYGLDAEGIPLNLTTTQCGRSEQGIPASVQAYCDIADQNLLSGWSKRRNEWQLGIGIQHELLPRLSAEVTYNRRWYYNQNLTDQLTIGCDLYNGAQDFDACVDNTLNNYVNPQYDFYSIVAPSCESAAPGSILARNTCMMPEGGGYAVQGISNQSNPVAPVSPGSAVTLTTRQVQVWRGVDTNFVLRARGGMRISGGTSTGSQYTDNCHIMVNAPDVTKRETGSRNPSCLIERPFQTNVRGSVSYTIPWIDVLASTVFQYRPGVEMSANYTYRKDDVVWIGNSGGRATATCPTATNGIGCFYGGNQTTATTNLINAGDKYGEGIRLFDVKLAKNIRFGNKRVNLGLDIYNLFNTDAALGYDNSFNNATTLQPNQNFWTVNSITSPRFARFQVQFDF